MLLPGKQRVVVIGAAPGRVAQRAVVSCLKVSTAPAIGSIISDTRLRAMCVVAGDAIALEREPSFGKRCEPSPLARKLA